MEKFYVITAKNDVGAEFVTWADAAAYCDKLRKEGYEPVILGPGCDPGDYCPSWA